MKNRIKGVALAASSAALYGLNPLFAVPLYGQGMAPSSVLFFRYLFASALLVLYLLIRRAPFGMTRRQTAWIFLLGILFGVSSQLLFESYRWMDVGLASSLLFVYPVLTTVFMALFFHEKMKASTVISLLLAVGGVALLSGGGGNMSLAGFIMVLLSAFTYAGYLIGVRETAVKDLSSAVLTLYTLLFGLLVFAASIAVKDGLQLPQDAAGWGLAFGSGLFCTTLSLGTLSVAIHYVGPTVTSILGALEPVTGVLIGVLAFGERLTAANALGIFLIITAVMLIIAAGPIMHAMRYGKRKF